MNFFVTKSQKSCQFSEKKNKTKILQKIKSETIVKIDTRHVEIPPKNILQEFHQNPAIFFLSTFFPKNFFCLINLFYFSLIFLKKFSYFFIFYFSRCYSFTCSPRSTRDLLRHTFSDALIGQNFFEQFSASFWLVEYFCTFFWTFTIFFSHKITIFCFLRETFFCGEILLTFFLTARKINMKKFVQKGKNRMLDRFLV